MIAFLVGCVIGSIITITVLSWIIIYREDKRNDNR